MTTTQQAHRIRSLTISRDQYKQDLAETEDKLTLIQRGMEAMKKKYHRYGTETECTTVKLICSLILHDIETITKLNEQNATILLKH